MEHFLGRIHDSVFVTAQSTLLYGCVCASVFFYLLYFNDNVFLMFVFLVSTSLQRCLKPNLDLKADCLLCALLWLAEFSSD